MQIDKNLLNQWLISKNQLEAFKAEEMRLRKLLTSHFVNPKEGTNKAELPEGLLTMTYKINRKVDESSLEAVMSEMDLAAREGLIVWKPNLGLKKYKTLGEEQRLIFDQTLIIEPATPSLEFTPKEI